MATPVVINRRYVIDSRDRITDDGLTW